MTVVRQASKVTPESWAAFGGAESRILHRKPDGGLAAQVRVPGGWQGEMPAGREASFEILVLDGELIANGHRLEALGYLHAPAAATVVLGSTSGATLAVFADPPRKTDGPQPRMLATGADDWHAGTVASRDTGRSLALEVRDLYRVNATGQRTWLLRAGADLALPYERHRTVEEGYLVRGHYRLVECLASGQVRFDHDPGGYFWRPAGIVHGGPDSGSDGEFLMLLRTPEALTVEFMEEPA